VREHRVIGPRDNSNRFDAAGDRISSSAHQSNTARLLSADSRHSTALHHRKNISRLTTGIASKALQLALQFFFGKCLPHELMFKTETH